MSKKAGHRKQLLLHLSELKQRSVQLAQDAEYERRKEEAKRQIDAAVAEKLAK